MLNARQGFPEPPLPVASAAWAQAPAPGRRKQDTIPGKPKTLCMGRRALAWSHRAERRPPKRQRHMGRMQCCLIPARSHGCWLWGRFPGFGSNWGRERCSRLSHARRASHLLHETFPLTSYSRKSSSQRKLPLPWLRVPPGHKPPTCSHTRVCRAMGPGCPVRPGCPTGAHP